MVADASGAGSAPSVMADPNPKGLYTWMCLSKEMAAKRLTDGQMLQSTGKRGDHARGALPSQVPCLDKGFLGVRV